MIISYTIDPEIFDPDSFKETSAQALRILLEDIKLRGVLIAPEKESLQNAISTRIEHLGQKYKTALQIHITELFKEKKKYIARSMTGGSLATKQDIASLASDMHSDYLVGHADSGKVTLGNNYNCRIPVLERDEYIGSPAHQKNIDLSEESPSLAKLSLKEALKTVGKCVRYVKELTIVDRNLGLYISDSNTRNRTIAGIQFILKARLKSCPIQAPLELTFLTSSQPTNDKRYQKSAELEKMITKSIENNIEEKYRRNVTFIIVIKRLKRGKKMLDRFLLAKDRAFQISHDLASLGHLELHDIEKDLSIVDGPNVAHLKSVDRYRELPTRDCFVFPQNKKSIG